MSNPRTRNGHRRRQLLARHRATATHCALCGRPIDKTLPPGDPGALEVDEIIPVSLGGDPLSWRNTQPTHRRCNQAKSNKLNYTPDTPTPAAIQPNPSAIW